VVDKDDASVPGEDDLLAITLDMCSGAKAELPGTDTVTITWTNDTKIDVFEGSDKSTPVSSGATYQLSALPKTLYVEGDVASGSVRDIEIKLEYTKGGTTCEDKVKVTVVDVDLKEVSFSGDNYHVVRRDDDSGNYSAPHWQDNSSPLDGDTDDVGDKKYPACFKRNTKMKTSVKIIVTPTAAFAGTVKIKGDGPGNLDIPETTAAMSGNEATITNVECSNAFANHVKWYGGGDILKIKWYISRDGGATWLDTMRSDNEAFITLDDPACATDFRTVLYLATEGSSATTESACITETWANFSGPANVCSWDETNKSYSRELHYYDGNTDVTSAADLLSTGDGQCHAWAELFKECLLANNVANLKKTRVLPPDPYVQFGVKNIDFDDVNPTYPQYDPWQYKENSRTDDLDVTASGIAGQNKATPYHKLFSQHWMVHRTGDATYYDPSYGTTTTGPADFTTSAIDAWGAWYYDPNPTPAHYDFQWRKESSTPSVDVTFTDLDW